MARKKSSDSKSAGAPKIPSGTQTSVTVPPPAYQVRPGTIPVVSLSDLGKSVLTAGAGALITSVFITPLQGGTKLVGAAVATGLGILFTATSPIGTIPSELGIGMLSSAAGWFVFDVTGKLKSS